MSIQRANMTKLYGKICKCQKGIVGVVTHVVISNNDRIYHGITFDGKKWQSKLPLLIADSIEEYYAMV